jgi:CRP-like cAMP-binding protein
MSTDDPFAGMSALGDAIPFVPRIREIIEAIALFEDFDPHDLEVLAKHMRCYRAPAGMEIIREGDRGDFMVLILTGAVEIIKLDARGLPAQIATAGPGKTLGEMSLIDGEPRFASCIAIDEVEFAVLDRTQLSAMISEEPLVGVKLMMEFLMLLNQRLRNVSGQLMDCVESRRNRIR